jgi:hypothetical protein
LINHQQANQAQIEHQASIIPSSGSKRSNSRRRKSNAASAQTRQSAAQQQQQQPPQRSDSNQQSSGTASPNINSQQFHHPQYRLQETPVPILPPQNSATSSPVPPLSMHSLIKTEPLAHSQQQNITALQSSQQSQNRSSLNSSPHQSMKSDSAQQSASTSKQTSHRSKRKDSTAASEAESDVQDGNETGAVTGEAASGVDEELSPGNEPKDLKSRLLRKAELARASRRRKKAYVQNLELQCKQLSERLAKYENQSTNKPIVKPGKGDASAAGAPPRRQSKSNGHANPIAKDSTQDAQPQPPPLSGIDVLAAEEDTRRSHQKTIQSNLSVLLAKPVDQLTANDEKLLRDLCEKFVLNSRTRQSLFNYHASAAQACLLPGLQQTFAMWGLDQSNNEFYEPGGLWHTLMTQELHLTPQQQKAILAHRNTIHMERQRLAQCTQRLSAVQQACQSHMLAMHQTMDAIQACMTPRQVAKFYLWISNNSWCMSMLDTMQTKPLSQYEDDFDRDHESISGYNHQNQTQYQQHQL